MHYLPLLIFVDYVLLRRGLEIRILIGTLGKKYSRLLYYHIVDFENTFEKGV